MPLSTDQPFDPTVEVLLRYGVLRQHDAEKQAAFVQARSMRHLALGGVFKPDAVAPLQAAWPEAADSMVAWQHASPLANQLAWELCSSPLIRTLELLSGETALIPDPFFRAGGPLAWGQGASMPARHPEWDLAPTLVLDIALRGQDLHWEAGETRWPAGPGEALLWSAGNGAVPAQVGGPDGGYVRAVYYRHVGCGHEQ